MLAFGSVLVQTVLKLFSSAIGARETQRLNERAALISAIRALNSASLFITSPYVRDTGAKGKLPVTKPSPGAFGSADCLAGNVTACMAGVGDELSAPGSAGLLYTTLTGPGRL
jgi:hypothetical protein